MQKRHGIIVGVTILIVALAITMVSSMLKKKEGVKDKQPSLSVSQDKGSTSDGGNVKPSTTDNSSNSNVTQSNGGNTVVLEEDVTKPGANTNSNNSSNVGTTGIFEVSEDVIANPTDVINEIMLVSSKKVMLLDLDVNSNANKQMVYVVDMLSADGKKVSLYVNGVVYDDLKVGDTLNIHYNKYVNKNGVEIPLVLQATKTTSTNNG